MSARSYFYYNLHKSCWSQMLRGLVVDHHAAVEMWDVEFRVRPGGRARVLLEQRKNVHAFAVTDRYDGAHLGHPIPVFDNWPDKKDWIEIGYNPYKNAHFVRKDTGEPIYHAPAVILNDDRRVYVQLESNSK